MSTSLVVLKEVQMEDGQIDHEAELNRELDAEAELVRLGREPIPDYGDHMTIEEFIDACHGGGITDHDGSACYATAKHMYDVPAVPSVIAAAGPDRRFTHVVWFNK
jgi:hypothetical protein